MLRGKLTLRLTLNRIHNKTKECIERFLKLDRQGTSVTVDWCGIHLVRVINSELYCVDIPQDKADSKYQMLYIVTRRDQSLSILLPVDKKRFEVLKATVSIINVLWEPAAWIIPPSPGKKCTELSRCGNK